MERWSPEELRRRRIKAGIALPVCLAVIVLAWYFLTWQQFGLFLFLGATASWLLDQFVFKGRV